jgi:hypothetical protein
MSARQLVRAEALAGWSLAFAPALLFRTVALLSERGERVAVLAGAIFVALVLIDAILIAVVTSNLLA